MVASDARNGTSLADHSWTPKIEKLNVKISGKAGG